MATYSNAQTDKLYGLLPAVIRERDSAEGEPLRALMRIVEGQMDAIDADIGQLERDAFIETCEPWVIPYIGDLVGTIAALRREPGATTPAPRPSCSAT